MTARFQLTALGLGLAFALTAGVAPARASFMATVTGTNSPAGGGLTLYTYIVSDLSTSTDNVGSFSLAVPADANLTAVSAPIGYLLDYTAGNLSIAFDSPSAALDLTPGHSETFSFLSPDRPGQSSFTLLDYNNFNTLGGLVAGPVSVPEPASLILLGVGLPLAVAMLARRRSRKLASPA